MDKIKALLEQLAALVAEMDTIANETVDAGEGGEGDVEAMSAEQEELLRSLELRADALRGKIEYLEKVRAKHLELRSVLERGASAKTMEATTSSETTMSRATVPAIPRTGVVLKGFKGPDAEERAYRAGMHLKGFHFGDAEARRWCLDHGVESRDQSSGVNSLGGVLTSDILSSEVIRLVLEYGAFPAHAKNRTLTGSTELVARRRGGLTARAVGENVAPETSNITWDNIQFVPRIWGVDNRIPNSLLEDSVVNLADETAVEIAQAFAETFDNCGFIGTGAATFHGTVGAAVAIIDGTHTAGVVNAASTDTTFGTLKLSDFTDCMSRLPAYSRRNAKWYISPVGYGAAMLRLMIAASGNNAADVAGGAALQFLGFPVVLCHPLESALTGTNSNVACLFGDMSQAATFAMRRDINIVTDKSRFVELDQTLVFATARVAMLAHDLGDTSTAGPIVALRFAAS